MKPPRVELSWSLHVTCPSCEIDFDIVEQESEIGLILACLIFNNLWDKVPGHDVYCPSCKTEFQIGEVEY